MLNTQAMHDRDSFIESHGHYVMADGFLLFADGALVEDHPMGRMIPPSKDKYERAQITCKYWLLVSQADEAAFVEFKGFLESLAGKRGAFGGRGVPGLHTDEDRLGHLRTLQLQAKRSRARYMAAKRKVKAETPYWMVEREQSEVEDDRKRQDFLSQVDGIQL